MCLFRLSFVVGYAVILLFLQELLQKSNFSTVVGAKLIDCKTKSTFKISDDLIFEIFDIYSKYVV